MENQLAGSKKLIAQMVGQHPDGNLFKPLTECQIDNGKKDGSTIGRKLPMFYPQETFKYLMEPSYMFGKCIQKM